MEVFISRATLLGFKSVSSCICLYSTSQTLVHLERLLNACLPRQMISIIVQIPKIRGPSGMSACA